MSCWELRTNWKWEKYVHLVFLVYILMGEMVFKTGEKCINLSLRLSWKWEKYVHLMNLVENLKSEIFLSLYDWYFQIGRNMSHCHFRTLGEICPLVYFSWYLYGRNMSSCLFLSITKMGEICPFVYNAASKTGELCLRIINGRKMSQRLKGTW